MTRFRLSWLLFTLASGAVLAASCGGDDDGTGGTGGKAGSGGSAGTSVTGGSGGVGGTGGTAGTAGKDGGSKDATTNIPCGETSCNPNGTNRICDTTAMPPRCVACQSDAQCANNMQNPPRLYCDVAAGACRSCLTDAHCMAPNRCIMGMNNNTCQLRCSSDADCANAPNNNRACNLMTMMCVQCQNNTHCVGNAAGPICVGNNCEQCGADTDCMAPTPICDATNNTCVQCRDNTQCAEPTPICVTTGANTCRQCGTNADCATRPGLPACVMNTCRQCNGANPCPAGFTCTMNNCVAVPEAGPPEAGPDGREGGSDVSEGGAETGTDAPASDAPADSSGG
jgi:hypothetical protein